LGKYTQVITEEYPDDLQQRLAAVFCPGIGYKAG